jgi:hypothetical protein
MLDGYYFIISEYRVCKTKLKFNLDYNKALKYFKNKCYIILRHITVVAWSKT